MKEIISLIYVDDSESETTKFEKIACGFSEIEITELFNSAETAFEFACVHKPDLALIDIVMPEGNNGIWLAEKLNEINIPFAFISSHSTFGFDAFKTKALHYLPRPVTSQSVRDLIERYKQLIKTDPQHKIEGSKNKNEEAYPKRIYVNTQKQIINLLLDNIVYIEAEGSYTIFHMADKQRIISGKNMKTYAEQVEQNPDFIKIHRSYIINQSHLLFINKKRLEMTFHFTNSQRLKVASFRRTDWLDKFSG